MATMETEAKASARVDAPSATPVTPKKSESILAKVPRLLDSVLGLLSSVRFGVTMLSILLICSIIGMVIMQQDVEGFHTWYGKLAPAQKLVYEKLDLFNIYHSWYFELLLAITGLNIILASIDRFPTAWQYVAKPKVKASPNFIKAQMFIKQSEVTEGPQSLAERTRNTWKRHGFWRVRVTEDNGRVTVFGQRNTWNRLGAYFVHVALLTIFIGGFVTSKWGAGGMMEIVPGTSSDTFQSLTVKLDGDVTSTKQLPFSIECTDLQQKLVHADGGLDATNTVDWLSYVNIIDKKTHSAKPALIHLNEPFDYQGYRLFQSRFEARGYARSMTLKFVPVSGGQPQEVTVSRMGQDGKPGFQDVPGLGRVSYSEFYPDFIFQDGQPETASGDYNNPVAVVRVVAPDGTSHGTLAFFDQSKGVEFASQMGKQADTLLINGDKVVIESFEKVASSHTLAVQYDPGRTPVYLGFAGLFTALCLTFFFAHQRVWAVIEPDGKKSKVYFGGNTNRARSGFEARFNLLVESVIGNGGTKHE